MNTQFPKPDNRLATYRKPNSQPTEIKRHNYEMIDYWLTSNRWKNKITNIETDINANEVVPGR